MSEMAVRDRGIALYRQAITLDPVNPLARSYLASTLALAGQFAEAQLEFPRIVESVIWLPGPDWRTEMP